MDLSVYQSLPLDVQHDVAAAYGLTAEALLATLEAREGSRAGPSLAGGSTLHIAHSSEPEIDATVLDALPEGRSRRLP